MVCKYSVARRLILEDPIEHAFCIMKVQTIQYLQYSLYITEILIFQVDQLHMWRARIGLSCM